MKKKMYEVESPETEVSAVSMPPAVEEPVDEPIDGPDVIWEELMRLHDAGECTVCELWRDRDAFLGWWADNRVDGRSFFRRGGIACPATCGFE